MENPGGGSGAGRVESAPLLNHRFPKKIRFPTTIAGNHEPWISWTRCHHIVDLVKNHRVDTRIQWYRLAGICQVVSHRKRVYLYRELMVHLSRPSLDFLFDGWQPPAYELKEVRG